MLHWLGTHAAFEYSKQLREFYIGASDTCGMDPCAIMRLSGRWIFLPGFQVYCICDGCISDGLWSRMHNSCNLVNRLPGSLRTISSQVWKRSDDLLLSDFHE